LDFDATFLSKNLLLIRSLTAQDVQVCRVFFECLGLKLLNEIIKLLRSRPRSSCSWIYCHAHRRQLLKVSFYFKL